MNRSCLSPVALLFVVMPAALFGFSLLIRGQIWPSVAVLFGGLFVAPMLWIVYGEWSKSLWAKRNLRNMR